MAADDDTQPSPDPWAELLGEDLAEKPGDMAFQFTAETPEEPAGPASEIAGSLGDAAASADVGEPGDADVDAWLSATDGDAAPPLSVFVPDEHVAEASSASTIEIGTGLSGISADGGLDAPTQQINPDDFVDVDVDVDVEEFWDGTEQPVAAADIAAEFPDAVTEVAEEVSPDGSPETADEAFAFPVVTEDTGTAGFEIDASLPVAAAAAGAATLAMGGKSPTKVPAKAARKQGGIGQIVGIVAGGLMAIPIVLGILIGSMWMGARDTMGLGKSMPAALRFLLPPKSGGPRQTAAADGPNLGAASSLDDLAAAGGTPADGGAPKDAAATEPRTDAFAAALADTQSAPTTDTPAPDAPTPDTPAPDAPTVPSPVPVTDLAVADPLVPASAVSDILAAVNAPPAAASPAPEAAAPAVAAAPEPPPLDTAELEASVGEASSAFTAVASAVEPTVFERKVLLVDWYKSLAKVAEDLVTLENKAAESGRPMDTVPKPVAEMHEAIAAEGPLAAEIARLGRQWLAFANRRSDGVVLAVTFDSARRVGPYWSSKVSLEEFDGGQRELSIISRSEPTAARGDRLVVTGVVFDDGVIWAADCRPIDAAPAVGPDF